MTQPTRAGAPDMPTWRHVHAWSPPHGVDRTPGSNGGWIGYGSIPIIIPFLGGWTSIYQLFWCELQGYKVLTHPHMNRNEWIDTWMRQGGLTHLDPKNPGQDSTKDETEFAINKHDNLTKDGESRYNQKETSTSKNPRSHGHSSKIYKIHLKKNPTPNWLVS